MQETVLIAGTGELQTLLIQSFLGRNIRVVSTAYNDDLQEPGGKNKEENPLHTVLPWTPSSSLSPRNILIHSERESGPLKAAYLVFPSGRTTESFHDTTSATVQKILDYRVKSYIFFLKELINYFITRKEGELNAVLYSEEGECLSPLIAGTYDMFRAVTHACFNVYEREPFCLRGFESHSQDLEGYGQYILKQSCSAGKKGNKFYRYPRGGFFSFLNTKK